MLVEEVLHLLLVVRQRGGGNLNLVTVFVVPFAGDLVYGVEVVREFVVDDAEFGEVGWVDGAAGVVGEALVALVCLLVGWRCGWERGGLRGGCRTSRLSL
jgi:hypothetical protein